MIVSKRVYPETVVTITEADDGTVSVHCSRCECLEATIASLRETNDELVGRLNAYIKDESYTHAPD